MTLMSNIQTDRRLSGLGALLCTSSAVQAQSASKCKWRYICPSDRPSGAVLSGWLLGLESWVGLGQV